MPGNTMTLTLVAAAIAATFAAPAAAEGPYAGFAGGGNFPRDQDLGNGQGMVGFEEGPLGVFGVGYGFASGLRPELELGLRDNDTDSPGESSGEVESMMGNLWVDFPAPGFAPRLRPFVGAGAGTAEVDFNGIVDDFGVRHGGRESVTAYQAGAGVGYDVRPNLALSLSYRYLQTEPERFTAGGDASRYRSDAVLLGLHFGFGSRERPMPVAAAEPAPAPEPQVEVAAFETIVLRGVNFQFDEADLTPPARESLDELATRLQSHQNVSVLVEGHTDAFGTDAYNLELGKKRAEAVREYLVGKGLKAEQIEVVSRGESQPAATNATEEGRALNRRTEVEPREPAPGVKLVVEPPTEDSVDAAKAGDPGGQPPAE
jgi:outer membrane protein OmpA-like peptidoglycan-associated protein